MIHEVVICGTGEKWLVIENVFKTVPEQLGPVRTAVEITEFNTYAEAITFFRDYFDYHSLVRFRIIGDDRLGHRVRLAEIRQREEEHRRAALRLQASFAAQRKF